MHLEKTQAPCRPTASWFVFGIIFAVLTLFPLAAVAAEQPGGAVDRYLAAYSAGDVAAMLANYSDDISFQDVSQRHGAEGREAMKAQLGQLRAMHSAMKVEELRRATTGNLVTVEVVYSGTLDCAALGMPDHPDVSYSLPAVLLFEVEQGHIRRQTDYLDFRTLMELKQSLQPPSAAH